MLDIISILLLLVVPIYFIDNIFPLIYHSTIKVAGLSIFDIFVIFVLIQIIQPKLYYITFGVSGNIIIGNYLNMLDNGVYPSLLERIKTFLWYVDMSILLKFLFFLIFVNVDNKITKYIMLFTFLIF